MTPPFIKKLASAGDRSDPFSAEDRALLMSLCEEVRPVAARQDIIREGRRPDHVNMMVDGWSFRYKLLPHGARQITAFLVPGDFCDAHITLFDHMDHSIATLTESQVAFIPREKILELAERPRIARALWWASLVDEAILRSWIVNLGRRDAFERTGHLFCEIYIRLCNVGLAAEGEFELPLTQEELADALGMTAIHMNRTLKRLREEGMISIGRQHIAIRDIAGLQRRVGFDRNYLHLPEDA